MFPILIIGVAAVIQWRSQRDAHTDAAPADIEAMVIDATLGSWGGTEPFLAGQLAPHLPERPTAGGAVEWRVEVADPTVREATGATHLVRVFERGEPRLLVRCRYHPDPLRRAIVGFELLR